MAEFQITDADLTGLSGKVTIVTGGSSGIGLATVDLLLSLGATVINGDIQPPPSKPAGDYIYVRTDVSKWADLVALFQHTKIAHGRVDHVFCNAGLGPRADYLSLDLDANGDPVEPSYALMGVSLRGLMNTATLAIHHMREKPEGCSIVIMGSTTGLQPLRAVDYSTAKAGTLGFGRGLVALVKAAGLPIRVNTLAPSWTDSNVLPGLKAALEAIEVECQPAEDVARAAALLMADEKRNGELLHVCRGKYKEIDHFVLLPAFDQIRGDYPLEDDVLGRLAALQGA